MINKKLGVSLAGLVALGATFAGTLSATAASNPTSTVTTSAGADLQSGANVQVGDQSGLDVAGTSDAAASSDTASLEASSEATSVESDGAGGHQDVSGVDVGFTGQQ